MTLTKVQSCINFIVQGIARRSVGHCTEGCHHPHVRGNLDVNVSRAWGLARKDFLGGRSDPYVIVTAVKDSSLIEFTMQTSSKKNTQDPRWNEVLSFGCGYWKFIKVIVKDRDNGKDDTLLSERSFTICEDDSPVCFEDHSVPGEPGRLEFEIRYRPDGNDCYPNPCYNGGTCREYSCNEYRCSCPSGYTGKRCEIKSHYGGGSTGGGSPGGGPRPIIVDRIVDTGDEGFNNYWQAFDSHSAS